MKKTILSCLSVIYSGVSLAQKTYIDQEIQTKPIDPPNANWVDNDFSWVKTQWLPEKSYAEKSVVKSVFFVEKSLQQGKRAEQIRAHFDQKLKSNPNDWGNRVGWSYAAYMERYTIGSTVSEDERRFRIAKADWLLHDLPKTSVCELYKVRFFVHFARLSFDGNPLKHAGIRLVKKYPDNKYILLDYAYILASLNKSKAETQKAIDISNGLLKLNFNHSQCYSTIAMAHWGQIISERSPSRAKLAIQNYRLAYNASTSERGRKLCLFAIEKIKWACKNKGIKIE